MLELRIREVKPEDIEAIVSIETTCFPSTEAASKSALEDRISVYSKGFFVGEVNNQIVGFINGGATSNDSIEDDFFKSMDLHKDDGKNLVIFGLDVHPHHQKRGYARKLMDHFIYFAKAENKQSIILTCKEHLVHYYESFGYENLGVSESTHGGAKWFDMVLKL